MIVTVVCDVLGKENNGATIAGMNLIRFLKKQGHEVRILCADQDKKGQIIPAEITIYQDRSFTFELKLPPVSAMIKQELKLQKGSGLSGRETAGKLSAEQLKKIATEKMPDLNTTDLEQAMHSVAGTARSMGVEVELS